MGRRRCRHCGRLFWPDGRVREQRYCSAKDCQRARKRAWQKKKLREDSAYRLNQADAQKRWVAKNPGYWQAYRQRNAEYRARNAVQQRARNRRRRGSGVRKNLIAKMDVSRVSRGDISGTYELFPVRGLKDAKMDPIIVQLSLISDNYGPFGGDCKDRTRWTV